jgi:hypothetical protein
VLTHGFWQRRFSVSADVVGRTISMNDRVFTIVGVLEPSFMLAPLVSYVLRDASDADARRG